MLDDGVEKRLSEFDRLSETDNGTNTPLSLLGRVLIRLDLQLTVRLEFGRLGAQVEQILIVRVLHVEHDLIELIRRFEYVLIEELQNQTRRCYFSRSLKSLSSNSYHLKFVNLK